MKFLYLSLLSLAIIGQGAYFCYDFQSKKEQSLQTANWMREAFDARIADLQKDQNVQQAFFEKHDESLRNLFAWTAEDNEQTRKSTEDQTNHLLADLRDLRFNILTRLSETEIALKDIRVAAGEKADRALKNKIRIQSAKLFDPEAH